MSTIPNNDWESTMTNAEVNWCWKEINDVLASGEFFCASDFRAARAWKSSQRKRFKRLRSCCGCCEWMAYRWNWKKLRFDKFWLGFNYGH